MAIVEGFLLPFTLAIAVNSNFCRRLLAFFLIALARSIESINNFATSVFFGLPRILQYLMFDCGQDRLNLIEERVGVILP